MNLLRKFKYAIFLTSYFASLVLTKKGYCSTMTLLCKVKCTYFLNSNSLRSFSLRSKRNTMNLLRKFKYAIFLSSYFATLVLTKKNMCLQNCLPISELYKFSYLLVKPSTY